MMIKSMTGYGRARHTSENISILVEMKSVNHRYSDVSVRLPKSLLIYEEKVKRLVQQQVHRGKIDVFITVEGDHFVERSLVVDWDLLSQYVSTIEAIKQEHQLSSTLSVRDLMMLPELFQVTENERVTDEFENVLLETVSEAAQQLVAMREREGDVLKQNLYEKLQHMSRVHDHLEGYAPTVASAYEQRLEQKIRSLLQDDMEVSEDRILTEVAVFSEKASIDEELTRVKSHLSQFHAILSTGGVVGRKLDFLVQELNREINTIGSKANDVNISREVVELKSELEKIKEQIQNIE